MSEKELKDQAETIALFSKMIKAKTSEPFYSHDIMHCDIHECIKRNTCHRYLMYNKIMKSGFDYFDMFAHNADDVEIAKKGECKLYWEETNKIMKEKYKD